MVNPRGKAWLKVNVQAIYAFAEKTIRITWAVLMNENDPGANKWARKIHQESLKTRASCLAKSICRSVTEGKKHEGEVLCHGCDFFPKGIGTEQQGALNEEIRRKGRAKIIDSFQEVENFSGKFLVHGGESTVLEENKSLQGNKKRSRGRGNYVLVIDEKELPLSGMAWRTAYKKARDARKKYPRAKISLFAIEKNGKRRLIPERKWSQFDSGKRAKAEKTKATVPAPASNKSVLLCIISPENGLRTLSEAVASNSDFFLCVEVKGVLTRKQAARLAEENSSMPVIDKSLLLAKGISPDQLAEMGTMYVRTCLGGN